MVEQTQRIGTCNHRLVGVIARGKKAAEQAFFKVAVKKILGAKNFYWTTDSGKRCGVKYREGSYFPVSYLTEILFMCGNKSELSSY